VIKKIFLLAVFCALLPACVANRAVIKPGFDFSTIRTVRVNTFASDASAPSSGEAVRQGMIAQLIASGFTVVADNSVDVDAVISGSVTSFLPDQRFLVNSPNRGSSMIYGGQGHRGGGRNQVIEVNGSNVYNLGPAFGMPGSSVIASNATVGVTAYMTDARTGVIVWSNSLTYEGLDLTSALNGVVRFLVRSIPRTAPPVAQ